MGKGFEERILQKHQEMKEQAKQEYGHPNKFKHIKGAPITHLSPEDLPALAAYAASPQGITDYHNSQVNNNLSELLEGFTQSQLVIYTTIEEIEKDLIPEPVRPYFRDYCNIMEDEEFQTNTIGIPQIGLPPLTAWNSPETTPSPLKNASSSSPSLILLHPPPPPPFSSSTSLLLSL